MDWMTGWLTGWLEDACRVFLCALLIILGESVVGLGGDYLGLKVAIPKLRVRKAAQETGRPGFVKSKVFPSWAGWVYRPVNSKPCPSYSAFTSWRRPKAYSISSQRLRAR